MSTKLISAIFLVVLVSFALCQDKKQRKIRRIDVPCKTIYDCSRGLDCINDRCEIGIQSNYEKEVKYYPKGPRCDSWPTHWCPDNYTCQDNRCFNVYSKKIYDPNITNEEILKQIFDESLKKNDKDERKNLRAEAKIVMEKTAPELEAMGFDVAKIMQQQQKLNTQEQKAQQAQEEKVAQIEAEELEERKELKKEIQIEQQKKQQQKQKGNQQVALQPTQE